MDLVIDISNWQGAITPALVTCWAQHGVRRVIVQAVNPPADPRFPPGQTREQLQACKDAGMPTDCYVFFWEGQDPQAAVNAMELASGFDIGYWLADMEDDTQGYYSVLDQIRSFMALCKPDGVYTRRDWWERRAENTDEYAGLFLWDADWNRNPGGVNVFTPYGGWTARALQQYGSGDLCGATGLDMNVINPEVFVPPSPYVGDDYWAKFGPDGNNSISDRYDWPGVAANLEGVIHQVMQQTQAPDAECEAKLQQIQQIVQGGARP